MQIGEKILIEMSKAIRKLKDELKDVSKRINKLEDK